MNSPSYNATHCRIHYAHFRHLFPGHHGSKQLLCKFRPYKRAVCSMRSVFFSRAFPGYGYSYLFSMPNEEEESSTPTDQETRFSSLEAKLVALSSCFEALAHRFDARSIARPTVSQNSDLEEDFLPAETKRLIFPTRTL